MADPRANSKHDENNVLRLLCPLLEELDIYATECLTELEFADILAMVEGRIPMGNTGNAQDKLTLENRRLRKLRLRGARNLEMHDWSKFRPYQTCGLDLQLEGGDT